MNEQLTQPTLIIIFGGTGDLARRKLLPALTRLTAHGHLSAHLHILAVARDANLTDDDFRTLVHATTQQTDTPNLPSERLHYQSIGQGTATDFDRLKTKIEGIETQFSLAPENRVFYLALPPGATPKTVDALGQVGLNQSSGFTRIIFEKPFGTNLKTAQALNKKIHQVFDEHQIYRMDHYLGKDTVQNLLVFRFANGIFESMWNREHVESVYLTVAEELGVGTRANYYDKSGALRDMVQNHIAQLLTLMAMEGPYTYNADAIRQEKIKVLRSISPIQKQDVVFAQYTGGQINGQTVLGYLDESGVAKNSCTETFVAARLNINNWRWQGVPFYVLTGKRLPKRVTQLHIRFRNTPVCMFQLAGSCMMSSNILVLTLQPDEGFCLYIDVKKPGVNFELKRIPLSFKYGDSFGPLADSYETLLLEVLKGDQTLFVHGDEVEQSWRVFESLLNCDRTVYPYPAGSMGPKEAMRLRPPPEM